VRNWRTIQEEAWHNRTYNRRSTTSRSAAERKSNKEKRSSSSSSSSTSTRNKSESKDQRPRTKHPLADKRDDTTESMKAANIISETVIDNKESDNSHENTDTLSSPQTGDVVDNAVKMDQIDDHTTEDVSGIHSSNSHNEPMINTSETSDTGNEIITDSSSTKARFCENYATSDDGLENTLSVTTLITTTREANKVEPDSECTHDSCSTKKACEAKSQCSDNSRISPSGKNQRHSRSGSRSTTRNSRNSTEATKLENNDSHKHYHGKKSSSDSRVKQKGHSCEKRSRSRSSDIRKRKLSKHGDGHTHRTKSRRYRHDRMRSHGRRHSRSSSRRRNSFSASSDSDLYPSTKRNRKRESPSSKENSHRLKSESKRLKKLQKKAERALQKLHLELNNKETNLHWKKSLEIPALISASQDIDVNGNICDWKNAGITSDKPGCDTTLNVFDVDFIASYTSPVSSPSIWSDMESNSDDNLESYLKQTPSKKQSDDNAQLTNCKNSSENFVTTCDSNVTPPSCIVENFTLVVSVANDVRNNEGLLMDSKFAHDSTISEKMTKTSDALKAVAVAYDDEIAEVDNSDLQRPVHVTTETNPTNFS